MSWTPEELLESLRYGKLFLVKRVVSGTRKYGVVRIRRRKNMFYEAGPLQWKRLREFDIGEHDPKVGDYLYESQDRAVSVISITSKPE